MVKIIHILTTKFVAGPNMETDRATGVKTAIKYLMNSEKC